MRVTIRSPCLLLSPSWVPNLFFLLLSGLDEGEDLARGCPLLR